MIHFVCRDGQQIHLHFISAWSYNYVSCQQRRPIVLFCCYFPNKVCCSTETAVFCCYENYASHLSLHPGEIRETTALCGLSKRDAGERRGRRTSLCFPFLKLLISRAPLPFLLNQIRSVHSNTLLQLMPLKRGFLTLAKLLWKTLCLQSVMEH